MNTILSTVYLISSTCFLALFKSEWNVFSNYCNMNIKKNTKEKIETESRQHIFIIGIPQRHLSVILEKHRKVLLVSFLYCVRPSACLSIRLPVSMKLNNSEKVWKSHCH